MIDDIWAFLGLEKATLGDLEPLDEREKQPPPLKMAYPELDQPPASADDWRGQEPVIRIVNTILLCAVRDGAEVISIEPQFHSVRVRYTVNGTVREHIKLPVLALKPLVEQLKLMAQIEKEHDSSQWGSIRIRVDDRFYDLRVQTHATEWGECVELRFSTLK